MFQNNSQKDFQNRLAKLSRDELLDLIKTQDVQYIRQINRIEYVFKHKLRHLTWLDGSIVDGKPLTNVELARLIDPPFIFDKEMAKLGFTEEQQRYLHIASDPVIWAKHFLKDKPRAYQTLVLRDPNNRKVMRFGRRLGKTACMAFFCLWYCYTNNDAKIIVVAPMKSHVSLLYEEVLRLAKQNPLILSPDDKNCAITRYIQSPQYQIEFENGATIKFFTTGMKSNGKADVARGQEADVIILDEMDYMGKDDLIALLAMLQKTSDRKTTTKQLIGASTPSGQRNTFWDWNTSPDQKFSAFWYPSYVNPFWDKEMEEQMRRDYPNEQAYRHEIEADWGEDVEGVYPQRFVKLSFISDPEWLYIARPSIDHSFYVMGVDWDKYGAGVNIVVLEYCYDDYSIEAFANKMRVVYREEVNKGEFTYSAAVDRIVYLNEMFNPRHIYVDRGAGEAQIEMLHMYGIEHPHTGLHKKLEGWAFGESIEVRDPYTKEIVKKRLKNFMVDNLYKLLEDNRILFPSHDEQLFLQLISYVVLRVSQTTGEHIFAPGGNTVDHAHDALLLACFAIAYNYDQLLNPVYASKAISISNETFLPTFEVTTEAEKEIVDDIWGDGSAPVMIRRSMAYNLAGRRAGRNNIKRKMF